MSATLVKLAQDVGLNGDEFQLLRKVPVFHGVEDEQWPDLLRIMSVHDYPRNRLLFSQGESANFFFVVLDGWVRIFRSLPDGGEVTVSLFACGESLAEAAVFADDTYPVTGITVDNSRLLLISALGIRRALEQDYKLALNLLVSMSSKMHYLVRQLEQVSHRTTKQRVAAFLLQLAEGQGSTDIRLPLEKHLIAARLGMRPETLSRALAKLKADDVKTDGVTIRVGSLDNLRAVLGHALSVKQS